ncbi:family of serine hydrolases 1 [Echria macrotheca]|uniref:Family of serine hydrolases 1 n=1 Tax=Echria macrotheca TaxID=438768 RepID=A0AAJ0BHH0_9PEZI|nr:family of serine hydrolases 1 [Echria macrotheca]
MRVLCLHGQGTSAHIFKSQTVSLRAKLDKSYQFDFVDAPFHCSPAPGVRVIFESGHWAWWPPKTTVNAIRGAHLWLTDYIAANGPYDMVMGFSQGCSLIGSFLLYHAREGTPADEPLPFKAAVFVCGGLPLEALDDLGLPVSQAAYDIDDETVRLLKERAGALTDMARNPGQVQPGKGLWDSDEGLVHDAAVMPDESDVFGLDFSIMPRDVFVQIPTVHIYGAKDPRWPASVQLAYFCKNRKMYDHGGGHDIPRSTEVSEAIAELIDGLRKEVDEAA